MPTRAQQATGKVIGSADRAAANTEPAEPGPGEKPKLRDRVGKEVRNALSNGAHTEPGEKQSLASAALGVGAAAARGFATGNIAGAVKSGGMAAVKNKRLRNLILGIVGGLVAFVLVLVGGLGLMIYSVTTAAFAAVEQASQDSAASAGVDGKDLDRYRELATKSDLPWQVIASLAKTLGEDPDTAALAKLLDAADPDHEARDLGAGSVVTEEGATRTIGNVDAEKTAAEQVEKVYVTAMTSYPGMDAQKAKATYDRALGWVLGQSQRCAPSSGPGDGTLTVKGAAMTGEQVENTKIILGVIKSALPGATTADLTQAAHITIATAIVESRITNHDQKVDHTSLGIFQQQDWWGSDEQRLRPDWSTARFLKALFAVPGWQVTDPGVVAQTVQVSAFPDRYTQFMGEARGIVAAYWAQSPPVAIPADINVGVPIAPGGVAIGGSGQSCIVAGGPWVLPFDIGSSAKISDWFSYGDALRLDQRKHDGIDISMPEGSPVYSASAGKVIASSGNREDGGLGYYVIIQHGEVYARYLHFVRPPTLKVGDTVTPGQQVGEVGTTGDSNGNHLHFDLTLAGKKIDPVPYMLERGVDFRIVPLLPPTRPY
ncbi:M23 family metallopeptidase [Agromyces humi]|uniref:M23 family metallopeptidase n=1 Tax=Agromyces humi TaxID=1766800 RepID=UPI0013586A26|nr:M23 family metallopeptidase [Agromyces humi]